MDRTRRSIDLREVKGIKKNPEVKDYLGFDQVVGYFFRKGDPNRTSNFNLKVMHGINKVSIIIFLIGIIFLISKYVFLMNIESFRAYCLAKPGVTESFPFSEDALVFKVEGKMFALTNVDLFESINLKCDPEKAIDLRERYAAVIPGYHMNKKHWNTVKVDGSLSDALLKEWIDDSYNLVVAGLSKNRREALKKQQ